LIVSTAIPQITDSTTKTRPVCTSKIPKPYKSIELTKKLENKTIEPKTQNKKEYVTLNFINLIVCLSISLILFINLITTLITY